MIPIVAINDKNEKKATLFRVSNLWVINKQITEDKISAIAVADDIKNKFPGIVSK